MIFLRISSSLSSKMLLEKAVGGELLLLDPAKVASMQSLQLAFHLAKSSFRQESNIAKKFHLEFLLWLAGKKDISSALGEMQFRNARDALLVCFGPSHPSAGSLLNNLRAKRKPLGMKQNATAEELERISLSRVSN